MIRLVQHSSGAHETEVFTRGKNYFMLNSVVIDDVNKAHRCFGTELFQYTTSSTFYVYTRNEVQDLYDAFVEEIDGLPTPEQEDKIIMYRKVLGEIK
jgi:hypothetical protein